MNDNIKKLQDEIFCQRFELKTLSEIVNGNKSERWVSGFTNIKTEKEHMQRYEWVCNFTQDMRVLDIACGAGKGSSIMVTIGGAKEVLGCDIDEDTIKYAQIRNGGNFTKFKVDDAQNFNHDNKFDVIISFETIEHLKNPEQLLQKARESLTEQGCFFVSTPISKKSIDHTPSNKHHLIEWGFKEFHNIVKNYFHIEDIYVQLFLPESRSRIKQHVKKLLRKDNKSEINPPIKWDSCQFSEKKMGAFYKGYQILKCKK